MDSRLTLVYEADLLILLPVSFIKSPVSLAAARIVSAPARMAPFVVPVVFLFVFVLPLAAITSSPAYPSPAYLAAR